MQTEMGRRAANRKRRQQGLARYCDHGGGRAADEERGEAIAERENEAKVGAWRRPGMESGSMTARGRKVDAAVGATSGRLQPAGGECAEHRVT